MENALGKDMEIPSELPFMVDRLEVYIYPDRVRMGLACAAAAGEKLRQVLADKGTASIIFASAPSQLEVLAGLSNEEGIDWNKVTAFHMDEYIGLPGDAPQSFGNYLRTRFFNSLPFKHVFYMNGNPVDINAECERYADLLRQYPVDISFLGIGENGHIAFNDPHIADFNDPLLVKLNDNLDQLCRQQQVNDGWFSSVEDVPDQAITITIPGLLAAKYVYTIVPGKTKQAIIKRCLEGPVGLDCPGTVIRLHPASQLYLDADSAGLLDLNTLVSKIAA